MPLDPSTQNLAEMIVAAEIDKFFALMHHNPEWCGASLERRIVRALTRADLIRNGIRNEANDEVGNPEAAHVREHTGPEGA